MPEPILVVDDDRDIRDSLADTLADEGYAAVLVDTGEEGLAYLRTHPNTPLVLLDWNMLPMGGEPFRDAMRAVPDLSGIPIALLTADSRVLENVNATDFAACLKKPVNLEALFAVVARYWR